jgi:TonB family protein
MKNIKFYWLILLITFTVSFALPANAQAKKVRKKSKVTKKKVARKIARPQGSFKIGTENSTPGQVSDGPVSDAGGDSTIPPKAVRMGSENINPCTNVKENLANEKITSVSGGVVNGKATSLPKPQYPAAAKAVKAGGAVSVQVLIGEEGNVVSASAVSGHPLLRAASEQAARGARFSPTMLCGQKVKVSGIIVYNFVAQ